MQVTDYEMTKEDANGGTAIRNWLNALFGAVVTQNSGNEAPTTTYAFMWWYDTSNSTYYYLKQRNADNSAWNTIIRYKVSDKTIDFMLSGSALSGLLAAKAPLDSPLFTGNVGIGKNPTAKLDIQTTNNFISEMIFRAGIYGVTNGFYISKDGASANVDYNFCKTDGTVGVNINSAGSLLLKSGTGSLGFATGSGGTVTQAISKFEAVTLHKSTGEITTSNSSIPGNGAFVYFVLNNNLIGPDDDVRVILKSSSLAADPSYYDVSTFYIGNGSVRIKIQNLSAVALAETLVIGFIVFKGAKA